MQALIFRLHGHENMCNVFEAALELAFTNAEVEAEVGHRVCLKLLQGKLKRKHALCQ